MKRRRHRALLVALAVPVVALTLSSCGSDADLPLGAQDGAMVSGHLHNLAYDGDNLVLGTHYGLFTQAPDQAPVQISENDFDVMGLALTKTTWFASGHPSPDMEAPSDLGLMASDDGGVVWRNVSLSGEVDFHRLTASGDVIVGQSAPDLLLMRSEDAGISWRNLGSPEIFDLAINPLNNTDIIATTERGIVRSTDGGETFSAVAGAPLVMLVAWSAEAAYGVDPDGQIHVSTDNGNTWQPRSSLDGQPIAIAAQGGHVAVLSGDQIWESKDGGESFDVRIVNLGGH